MNSDERKRVLVTGGAGFIGSQLCARLLERGYRVISVDNYLTGSRENIAPLLADRQFEAVHHDVMLAMDFAVDQIYNLACPASPVQYQDDPIRTTKTIVLGALNVLELASRRRARVLQASTSEVYGDPEVHPQPESYWGRVNPIGLRACYDEGKRCAESLFFDYQRQHDLSIKVARIFNTYGPNMRPDDGRVISTFITQALAGKPITIYGDGRQTRSFCYVDDLVEGLIRLMESPDEVTGPINLGRPEELTMLELAELVRSETGSSSEIIHSRLPSDDPAHRRPDITCARELLGWNPVVDLAHGLRNTVDYFRSRLEHVPDRQELDP